MTIALPLDFGIAILAEVDHDLWGLEVLLDESQGALAD